MRVFVVLVISLFTLRLSMASSPPPSDDLPPPDPSGYGGLPGYGPAVPPGAPSPEPDDLETDCHEEYEYCIGLCTPGAWDYDCCIDTCDSEYNQCTGAPNPEHMPGYDPCDGIVDDEAGAYGGPEENDEPGGYGPEDGEESSGYGDSDGFY